MGILLYELQLAAEGAAISSIGELLQHCIFKIKKLIALVRIDGKLDFLARQGGECESRC